MYKDGADLARGFGLTGIVIAVPSLLIGAFSAEGWTASVRGVPAWLMLISGCILLGAAAVGLVMMAAGSGWSF